MGRYACRARQRRGRFEADAYFVDVQRRLQHRRANESRAHRVDANSQRAELRRHRPRQAQQPLDAQYAGMNGLAANPSMLEIPTIAGAPPSAADRCRYGSSICTNNACACRFTSSTASQDSCV